MTPEGIVKKNITAVLKHYGDRVYYFMPATHGYGRSGVSDFVGWADGRAFAIEAKAADGRLTALQLAEQSKCSVAGGYAIIIRDEASLMILVQWLSEVTGLPPYAPPVSRVARIRRPAPPVSQPRRVPPPAAS
jgi:hypothetical protein